MCIFLMPLQLALCSWQIPASMVECPPAAAAAAAAADDDPYLSASYPAASPASRAARLASCAVCCSQDRSGAAADLPACAGCALLPGGRAWPASTEADCIRRCLHSLRSREMRQKGAGYREAGSKSTQGVWRVHGARACAPCSGIAWPPE